MEILIGLTVLLVIVVGIYYLVHNIFSGKMKEFNLSIGLDGFKFSCKFFKK